MQRPTTHASTAAMYPARMAAVSGRRAALGALTRKYGEDIDEVLAWSQRAAQRLLALDDSEERVTGLRARRDDLRSQLAHIAGEL